MAKPARAPERISVSIDASFIGPIQRNVSVRILREFLAAWKKNVESANARNKVVIVFGGSGASDSG